MQLATQPPNTPTPHPARPASTARGPRAEAEDLDLVRRVAAADHDALETLYRRYTPRLASFLQPMLRDAALIDEVINEVMFVVWQQASRFQPMVRLSTWIFAIARNKARKALAQRISQLREVPVAAVAPAAPPDPESWLARKERDRMVLGALDTLPSHLRVVVHERYYQFLSYEEIATRQGCSTATVKTRMQHARRRLSLSLRREMRGGFALRVRTLYKTPETRFAHPIEWKGMTDATPENRVETRVARGSQRTFGKGKRVNALAGSTQSAAT